MAQTNRIGARNGKRFGGDKAWRLHIADGEISGIERRRHLQAIADRNVMDDEIDHVGVFNRELVDGVRLDRLGMGHVADLVPGTASYVTDNGYKITVMYDGDGRVVSAHCHRPRRNRRPRRY